MMPMSKNCATCGKPFVKPPSCSMAHWNSVRRFCSKRCGYDALKGTVGHRKGKGGGPGSLGGRFIACRICDAPTKYHWSKDSPLLGKVNCGLPECRQASKAIKGIRLSATRKDKDSRGEWIVKRRNWLLASQIASEEKALEPWMREHGWITQHKILTGVHSYHEPRYYKLDFAHLGRSVCVEIDGTSHKLPKRKISNERRDAFMCELGWRTLRVPAKDIVSDIEAVKLTISDFLHNHDTI